MKTTDYIEFFLQTIEGLESLSSERLSEYGLSLIAGGIYSSIKNPKERAHFADFCLEEKTIII